PGVEQVGERDAGWPDQPRHGVGVRHLEAAAECELDVLPADARVVEGGQDGLGAHVHGRLVTEPAERVEAHPDDGDVVHLELVLLVQTDWNAYAMTSDPSSSTKTGNLGTATSIPNRSSSGSRPSSRPPPFTTSSSS